MAKICLDAGHGGKDPGACAFGRQEADDVLKMTLKVGGILDNNGHTIHYTRTSDIYESVNQKASEANNFGADFFASFHRNSASASAAGYESLVYENSGRAKICADAANAGMETLGFKNRGTKIRTDLAVLNSTKMEAVLFEMGFISNSGDNALYDSKFDQIANTLASAIAKAVGSTISTSGSKPSSSGSASKPSSGSSTSASYYKKFNSSSIVDGLKSIGVDSNFANRKKIAAANGISNYEGTASQNTKLLNLAKQGKLKKAGSSSSSSSSSSASYYKKFSGTSIVDGLKSIGVDSSMASRKRIAKANGISNYEGTASQNTKLLSLAKQGKLKKP